MKKKTPPKLIVCMLKVRHGKKASENVQDGTLEEHARYMADLWRRGIFWAGGPSADGKTALEIYSVDSIEEAMKAQRNAPHYINGHLYEDTYWEWTPRHWPPPTPGIDPSTGKELYRQT
jgi:hypothetical protein